MVSPRFHVNIDDFFEKTIWKEFLLRSEWQYKTRLIKLSMPELDPATITKMILPNQPTNKVNAVNLASQTDIKLAQMPADPWENSENKTKIIAIHTQLWKLQ